MFEINLRFFTCKNAIILFLQIYRLLAIYIESHHEQTTDSTLASNKADAVASLKSAAINLDKYVLLTYTEKMLIKNKPSIKIKSKSFSSQMELEEPEKKSFGLNPILAKTTLCKNYSYAIVLTQNSNLSAECCECDCHSKEINRTC
jgi:hypothetical protein